MKQTTLFDLEAFTQSEVTSYNPAWDEDEQTYSVGGQSFEVESPYKSVGEQVASNTKKSAPQHDTHWVEKYWVERAGNKYWYYRYCWMSGRKIKRRYLGAVSSLRGRRQKKLVEDAISDGQSPIEIEQLIHQQRGQPSQKRSRL